MPRRDHLHPPRSPIAKWAGRVLGIAATGVVLAVGVVVVSMLLPGDDDRVVSAAPAATPVKDKAGKDKKGGLTRRQREQRRRAVAEVRRQGYRPAKLEDYRADHVLRVLIGKPAGGTPAGRRAFFFVRGRYVGQDSPTGSLRLRPGRQLEREISLVYTLYESGDLECCPQGGETRVHFRWNGTALEPREDIPANYLRMPTSFGR